MNPNPNVTFSLLNNCNLCILCFAFQLWYWSSPTSFQPFQVFMHILVGGGGVWKYMTMYYVIVAADKKKLKILETYWKLLWLGLDLLLIRLPLYLVWGIGKHFEPWLPTDFSDFLKKKKKIRHITQICLFSERVCWFSLPLDQKFHGNFFYMLFLILYYTVNYLAWF